MRRTAEDDSDFHALVYHPTLDDEHTKAHAEAERRLGRPLSGEETGRLHRVFVRRAHQEQRQAVQISKVARTAPRRHPDFDDLYDELKRQEMMGHLSGDDPFPQDLEEAIRAVVAEREAHLGRKLTPEERRAITKDEEDG